MESPSPANRSAVAGRGAWDNPPNRFARLTVEDDWDQLADGDEPVGGPERIKTEYFIDDSKSILSENDSPDLPFRYSLNPYRGCIHGCAYCYARPTHEYLGLSAGLDFETKVFVKLQAAELVRKRLAEPDWQAEPIMLSGVTDCYQPAERTFRLTRQCVEVAAGAAQPINVVTKNALVTRDLDLLASMAARRLAGVAVSLTTLDQSLSRELEPRTSSPAARLRAIRELSSAGVPTRVMLAPIIPGLNDSEIPALLRAASEHGAQSATCILLRLPLTVQPIFLEWLARRRPGQSARIESLIRSTRDGRLNDSQFGRRMQGTGELAEQIHQTFRVFAKKFGLDAPLAPLDRSQFQPPRPTAGQLRLF